MLNISQVILMRTDSNMCRKELTVHWSAPNSLITSYLQPCTNSMLGDKNEAVAPIIWLYQTVDAQKEEVFFPDLLITLRRHVCEIGLSWATEHLWWSEIQKYLLLYGSLGPTGHDPYGSQSTRNGSHHWCLYSLENLMCDAGIISRWWVPFEFYWVYDAGRSNFGIPGW